MEKLRNWGVLIDRQLTWDRQDTEKKDHANRLLADQQRDVKLDKIYGHVDRMYGHIEEDKLKELANWFCPYNFMEKESASSKRTFQSSTWFLESLEFKAWVAGRDWILWCSGEAGVGKVRLPVFQLPYKSTL